ncbi:MAG: DUF4834 family protein [Paludibacteraceae bacterium]
MFKLLFGIILFFFIILFFTGVLGISFLRSLFRGNNRPAQQQNDTPRSNSSPELDKIFSDHEGEYVDFEEIKEEEKNTDKTEENLNK